MEVNHIPEFANVGRVATKELDVLPRGEFTIGMALVNALFNRRIHIGPATCARLLGPAEPFEVEG